MVLLCKAGLARTRVAARGGGRRIAGGSGIQFLLATLLFAVADLASMALSNLHTEGLEEKVQLPVKILLRDAKIPFQEEQELLLHQVDLGAAESEGVGVGVDVAVVGPVLVLW